MKRLKHIEFFAGCGGMSLGLKSAGFSLAMANELSPMASQTFAYNLLGQTEKHSMSALENVLWVESAFQRGDSRRLKEDLLSEGQRIYSDLIDAETVINKLLVGDIQRVYRFLKQNERIINELRDVDVISGGPPCQSFSLAGKREQNNYKNKLPLIYAKTCGLIKPKVVVLENVRGILSPFKSGSQQYHAWVEVSKAFCLEGFVPVSMLLNAKFFGVPQNRPRFIMYAFREDIFEDLRRKSASAVAEVAGEFYDRVRGSSDLTEVGVEDCRYFNIEDECDREYFDGVWLPRYTHMKGDWVTVEGAIGDLSSGGTELPYPVSLEDHFGHLNPHKNGTLENHEERKHNAMVRSRFQFLQLLSTNDVNINLVMDFIRNGGQRHLIGEAVREEFVKIHGCNALTPDGQMLRLNAFKDWVSLADSITWTKKHTQKALIRDMPAPAQLTIPDDMCHYDTRENRVLTVREMARIQSFPDWFVFKSKPTTGGVNRRFEVPQYTQVGNAVPPLLAKHLGLHLRSLLDKNQTNGVLAS